MFESTPIVFFVGHGRQGTTYAAHLFLQRVNGFDLIENFNDGAIRTSTLDFKKLLPKIVSGEEKEEVLVKYFDKDPIWCLARRSNLPIICKFPWSSLIVPFLHRYFPKATFIEVNRFPLDTIASIQEVYSECGAFAPIQEHSLYGELFRTQAEFGTLSLIERWSTILHFFWKRLRTDHEGVRSMRIRYEELNVASERENILDGMVQFSGLNCRERETQIENGGEINVNQLYGGSGGNHPTTARIGRFKRDLAMHEIDCAYRICRPIIDADQVYSKIWSDYCASVRTANDRPTR